MGRLLLTSWWRRKSVHRRLTRNFPVSTTIAAAVISLEPKGLRELTGIPMQVLTPDSAMPNEGLFANT